MTYRIHQPGDFLAPPAELPIAGAPSPVAFRRLVKRRLFSGRSGDLDAAWHLDAEIDQLISGRLLHLVWALGVQVEAAQDAGLVGEARGWLSGTATAAALGLVRHDPLALGLSGADGFADLDRGGALRIELAVPPSKVGDVAAWLLEWGRTRRRRFTVALVAPGGRLLPFDWETVRELAHAAGRGPRVLELAWVPGERAVQIPWGETADGFPVALLPPVHLMSSGVHVVRIKPDELLGAAARRRPKDSQVRAELAAAVLRADDPAAYGRLSDGWMPPILLDERPELSGLLKSEKPATFEELITLVAFADDELRRDYFLERYQARRAGKVPATDELPVSAQGVVEPTRGLLIFTEQIARLIALYAGWEPSRAYRLAAAMAEPEGADLAFEAAMEQGLERGYPADELRAVALAAKRWAPLALSKRQAAPRAALIYELALHAPKSRRT